MSRSFLPGFPVKNISVYQEDSLRKVIGCIDASIKGVALVVDRQNVLIGLVTDGDVRRVILSGISLEQPVEILLRSKSESLLRPTVVTTDVDRATCLSIMRSKKFRHLPVVDDAGCPVDLLTADDFLADESQDTSPDVRAVLMAGGLGQRLRPLTETTPKPMLPLGDKPLLEHLIRQLHDNGVSEICISTFYLANQIKGYFGKGDDFGVTIDYLSEDEPLGTAGALSLIEHSDSPILVMNGDIVTGIDFRRMIEFHRENKAALTVGVRQFEVQIPYGVVKTSGVHIDKIEEKPNVPFLVSGGIYLLDPAAVAMIPKGQRFDMPQLIEMLIEREMPVCAFPIREYWLDIGRLEDYQRANADFAKGVYGRNGE